MGRAPNLSEAIRIPDTRAYISLRYISTAMRRIPVVERTRVEVDGVEGFFEKVVTKFGTGAKVDCPRQYLGRPVYVIIRRPKAPIAAGEGRQRRRPGKGRKPG